MLSRTWDSTFIKFCRFQKLQDLQAAHWHTVLNQSKLHTLRSFSPEDTVPCKKHGCHACIMLQYKETRLQQHASSCKAARTKFHSCRNAIGGQLSILRRAKKLDVLSCCTRKTELDSMPRLEPRLHASGLQQTLEQRCHAVNSVCKHRGWGK